MCNADESTGLDQTIRSMIQHENELVNHRLTWLITGQGLLFAALSFAWDKNVESLFKILILLGVGLSIIIFFTVAGASRAIFELCEFWDKNRPSDYKGPDVIGLRQYRGWLSNRMSHYIGIWSLLPGLFIVAWLAVWIAKS